MLLILTDLTTSYKYASYSDRNIIFILVNAPEIKQSGGGDHGQRRNTGTW